MSSISQVLNQFITDFRTAMEVNDFLIYYINNVLKGGKVREVIECQSMILVEILSGICRFYSSVEDLSVADFSIPTNDLKKIAEAWMFYLHDNQ